MINCTVPIDGCVTICTVKFPSSGSRSFGITDITTDSHGLIEMASATDTGGRLFTLNIMNEVSLSIKHPAPMVSANS